MFVEPSLKKATVFLRANNSSGREEIGTGFLLVKSLGHDDEDNTSTSGRAPQYFAVYVVTTRHTITDYRDQPIYLRLNTTDGGFEDVPTKSSDWYPHPKTDVAVLDLSSIDRPAEIFDLSCLPFTMLATKEYLDENLIVEGQEIFMLGLFISHPGKKQALPIVRFGNISLMDRESVAVFLSRKDREDRNESQIEAYLIEARSMGGLSGAPVLFYNPPLGSQVVNRKGSTAEALMSRFQLPILLGLVHGQYDEIFTGTAYLTNAGISIVVPAEKIRDVIMSKKLSGQRKGHLRNLQGKPPEVVG